MKTKKIVKSLLIALGSLVGLFILIIVGYVGYIFISYSRIGNLDLSPNNDNSSLEEVAINTIYGATTYNIGCGSYSQDYTFFLDTGYDDEGNETCGYYAKARSVEEVKYNVNGAIKTILDLDVDFAFYQEVDTNANKSYHVDERGMIIEAFNAYNSVFAVNYHSSYLAYPLYDMIGKSNSGILTLSKYKIEEAKRVEYTVSTDFSKFFDLDRCFSVSTIKTANGKILYLINNHMSAYDEGGVIREKQMNELYSFANNCYKNGDYVIIGGDYNHDLITYNPLYDYNVTDKRAFNMTKKTPDWVSYFFNDKGVSYFDDGFKVVADDKNPTCRNNDITWIPGDTFVCVVDGFIVSDNISIVSIENIVTTGGDKGLNGFSFSDHDPAYIKFKLN